MTESEIFTHALIRLGLDPRYKGFMYMHSILCMYSHYDLLNNNITDVYQILASEYSVSNKAIQKNFNAFVKLTWEGDRTFEFDHLFNCCYEAYTPTIKEFVAIILTQREGWLFESQSIQPDLRAFSQ